MQHVGYSLIRLADGAQIEAWGSNKAGDFAGKPARIILPNGDQVHCAEAGDVLGDWRLVERWADAAPSAFHVPGAETVAYDGTRLNVTREWVIDAALASAAVKAEAQRRIIARTGAADLNGCVIKQLNALMRGTELTNKRAMGEILTSAEELEALDLQKLADDIKAIRARSNVIEAIDPFPSDYAADARWTA